MEPNSRTPETPSQGGKKTQVCTAPHPAVSFVYFLVTLAVAGLVAYLFWKLR